MKAVIPYTVIINKSFDSHELLKGMFIVISHVDRIPPHIGMIADKEYHSLSIKGQELNVPVAALVRNNTLRKIPTVFIKIKKHVTFSDQYLKEHFCSNVQQFARVQANVATCLSPIKLFFEEAYNVPVKEFNYIFELLPKLKEMGLLEDTMELLVGKTTFQLPVYTAEQLNSGIDKANQEAAAIRNSIQNNRDASLN